MCIEIGRGGGPGERERKAGKEKVSVREAGDNEVLEQALGAGRTPEAL